MNFKELRTFLAQSERGQVFDSLVCVELGLEEYEAAWSAHSDMAGYNDEEDEIIVRFLVDLSDYLEVNNEDFDKVLASTT
jgi:hypothetical protein